MANEEFKLARLTPKTVEIGPRMPPGGIPELTAEDIAMAVGMIEHKATHQLICAKYLQDTNAVDYCFRHLIDYSWRLFCHRAREGKVEVFKMTLLAELCLREFLLEGNSGIRSIEDRATYIKVAKNTFVSVYQTHHREVVAYLFRLESEALTQIRKSLK